MKEIERNEMSNAGARQVYMELPDNTNPAVAKYEDHSLWLYETPYAKGDIRTH